MATLIGTALLVIAIFQIYRAWQRLHADSHTNPVLDRLNRDLHQSVDSPPEPAPPDTPTEAREGELSHELVAGRIDPAAYQRAMSELAHTTIEAGGQR